MTKYILVMLGGLIISSLSYSQGEIIQQKDLNYYNENSFGLKLSSNGFGIDYRHEYRYTNKTRGFLETGLDMLKDPKEVKLYNPYFTNQKKFVFGKINSVFKLQLGTGIQREIFSKQDKNSVSIRYQLAIGGSFAFAKPIYYQIVDSVEVIGNQAYIYHSPKLFNIDYHNTSDIVSKENWFSGVSETKIIPGAYVRAGMNFEFSNDRLKTKALELGAELNFFAKNISILAKNEQQTFISIYCSYRFGYKYSTLISRDARKFLRRQENK